MSNFTGVPTSPPLWAAKPKLAKKVNHKPKFDITKLMEMHADGGEDEGAALGRPEAEEAQNLLAAEIAGDKEEDE